MLKFNRQNCTNVFVMYIRVFTENVAGNCLTSQFPSFAPCYSFLCVLALLT